MIRLSAKSLSQRKRPLKRKKTMKTSLNRNNTQYYADNMNGIKPLKIKGCTTVIPMAGAGSRFSKEGYGVPKTFLEVNGGYMINQALRCLPETNNKIFACLRSHMSMLPLEDFEKCQGEFINACYINVRVSSCSS